MWFQINNKLRNLRSQMGLNLPNKQNDNLLTNASDN